MLKLKDLDNITIVGLGLLGGSLGLAVERTFPHIKRRGYSHRPVTRKKALEAEVVDEVFPDLADAVRDAQLVILATPIGTFPELMEQMAPHLKLGAIVTDVGSTKVLPARWAEELLPYRIYYLGSHPMAGSEQRGVDFARADLFDGAYCILTPSEKTATTTARFLEGFWRKIGMHTSRMTPDQHDRVLARISHLPHVLAMALVNCSDLDELLYCGKGFLDSTRIASGPSIMWRDILLGNAEPTCDALDRLIHELTRVHEALKNGEEGTIHKKLNAARRKRNRLVEMKLMRKELPGS